MVSSISSSQILNTGKTVVKEADVNRLVKYANNEAIKEVPDTFVSSAKGAIGSAALFEGIPLFNFIRRNKKINNEIVKNGQKAIDAMNKASLDNLLHGTEKIGTRVKKYFDSTVIARNTYTDIKAVAKAQLKSDKAAKKAAEAAEKLAKNPKNIISKKLAEKAADSTSKNAAKKLTKLVSAETTATTKKTAGKILKSSGAGVMLAISGIAEFTSEVIPTFKELGTKQGIKQLAKSAVRVVGDTAGFIVGEQVGAAAGTAVGTMAATKIAAAAGTAVMPGVGTVVGAICGFVGGILGSFVMGKVTKAITGKTEREIAQEQANKNTTNEIINNKQSLEELKNEVRLKIEEEAATNGSLSEDAMMALESLENLESTNPFMA